MAQATFKFISEAVGGSQFTVVSFSANEAISRLYRYELEIKAPLSAAINLDDVLDNPARFITELDGLEYPVYGVLSSIEDLKTVQGYVHYRAVLVPRLWRLSIYKTNEIYTTDKTVDVIIQAVLENAGLSGGTDFDIGGLVTTNLLKRDYRCQFGESDFDFLSRLMENEGIFYYFDHSGPVEKIVFINDMSYQKLAQPGLIFEVTPSSLHQHDCIDAWSCRKQRLPAGVRVRDYNPDHPSLDISDTMAIDQMGQGTEYLYGGNIIDENEASYLSGIRAEEYQSNQTRYYGESSATRLQPGYLFTLDLHPNALYNGVNYLVIEVNHEGQHLDMTLSGRLKKTQQPRPQYRNSFVAMEASEQFRPARVTPKPRFYGTMTAFIHAAQGSNDIEIDSKGRYLVHLPFDQWSGLANENSDTREHSAWIRMAQSSVGEYQGMYFPLKGGTEVLLTFINGDPDRPIITAALPNEVIPSLLKDANSTESILQTEGPLIEHIGVSSGTVLPDFSGITVARPDTIKNTCPAPASHQHANAPKLGTHIDGHANILSSGSFIVHAQTQSDGAGLKTTPTSSPAGEDHWLATEKNNPVDLTRIKFELLDDRVVLDTGGRDLLIHCNHYELDNASEINDTVGHDHATHHGTSYEKFQGDSEEYYNGNLYCKHDGTSTEHFYGNKFEWMFGGTESFHVGGKVEMALAESFELFVGLKQEISLAESFELFIGAKQEFALANSLEVFLGKKTEFSLSKDFALALGGKIDFNLAAGIEYAPLMVDLKDMKIEKKDVEAKVTTGASIDKKAVDMGTRDVKIFNETVHLKKVTTKINGVDGICIYGP